MYFFFPFFWWHVTLFLFMHVPGLDCNPYLFRCEGKAYTCDHHSYKPEDSSWLIGACVSYPAVSPDSKSKLDVHPPGFGNPDSWKCFSSASHFFRFSPLIPPDVSLTNLITAQTLSVHPHAEILQEKNTIINIAGVLFFWQFTAFPRGNPNHKHGICHDVLK